MNSDNICEENGEIHMLEDQNKSPLKKDSGETTNATIISSISDHLEEVIEPLVLKTVVVGSLRNSDNDISKDTKQEEEKVECNARAIENERKLVAQQKLIDKQATELRKLEEKYKVLENDKKDLINKLEIAKRQKELATKEKEAMVIRYVVSEKNVLDQKQQNEQCEKKYKEAIRENEIFQHKIQTMVSEKSRIAQMLDNKCYEHKNVQQELERMKTDMSALENKLKWSQNSLKTEIEIHKETQAKVESLNSKLQEATEKIEQSQREAQDSIKSFHTSQENRAHVLDQQVKEQQAALILLRHERDDKDQQVKSLQSQLEKLQMKQKDMLQENNNLSLKVQQLERDRLENVQKLSEFRNCADQQRQDSADLIAKSTQVDQLKLQLDNERDQLKCCNEQFELVKQRNVELESDMVACREREAELLLFTQQLTDKNVRLQSEFTALETKVQQLSCEQTIFKRAIKEQETRAGMLSAQLTEERMKYGEENDNLKKSLSEKSILCENLKREVADQEGENIVMKRKFELSLREVNKELQQCRKKLLVSENLGNTSSSSSSSSSLSVPDKSHESPSDSDQVKVIQPDGSIDRQTLIEHIVKLQRISARKSEKLDFLEEHVNTLVAELQKKSRLLQSYILRDQSGTLTSNTMDNNKANIAKLNGIMASVYSSRVADNNLTLELSLDINRKLQAILEDTLLKNMTLKENVDTLGNEIDRLNNQLKST